MLMLAHVILNELKVDVQLLNPSLHQSLLAVYCRLGTAASDSATIAMENARLSARGVIRKAHDVITWAGKLHTLKLQGLQLAEIIKKYNESATKDSAIQGAKRMGLVALLDLPEQCLSLLLQHVSEFGFDGCAFNETAFSNKKPMRGFQPRANSDRAWQKRLAATSEGYELLVRYVHCSHARKPSAIRSKLDTAAMTEATQMSQLLISCLQEIQDQHALPGGAKDKILQDFVDGDNNLELELQGAISELKKGWQPAELTPFRELIATCIAKRDGKLKALQKGPKISAGQLEKQAFEVLLSSLQHGVDTHAVWKAKCLDRDSVVHFQRLSHTSARHTRAREIADSVISEDRGLGWQISLKKFESVDAANIAMWNEACNWFCKGRRRSGSST